jgi:UDP-glucose 4-epimerase
LTHAGGGALVGGRVVRSIHASNAITVMRRISVTGAAGFLGVHLLRRLRAELPDAQISGVVRRAPAESVSGVEYVSETPVSDLIFHLAGSPGIDRSLVEPSRDLHDNALGTLALLEAARRMPDARFILVSSAAVYGRVDGLVSEEQPPRPISPYGVSKLAAEGYAQTYAHLYGVDCRIARIGNPYGPGQRRLAIYDLARRALQEPPPLVLRGTGSEVRDFVHAADVARALLAIALRGVAGHVYNVGSGQAVTLRAVAELVAQAAGQPASAVRADGAAGTLGKVHVFQPSLDKLTRLGYRAVVPLDRGIEETVAWVRAT